MILYPNAKINLGLNIVAKRPDGFHNIETVFLPVKGLHDVLEFLPSDEMKFELSGMPIVGNKADNLVFRAYELIKERFDLPGLLIKLQKNIPSGAGLGGGSSDAAFMLKGLQTHFQLPLNNSELISLASKLGSDCAFFIENEPSFAQGKGEILSSISTGLEGKFIALVKPEYSVNTKEAYSGIRVSTPEKRIFKLINGPISGWKKNIQNDFEVGIFQKYPELLLIKKSLYELGAMYASMSGSGSAIYGIFEKEPDIPVLPKNYFVWKGKI